MAQVSFVTLFLVLAYVSWLAFSIGRLYEQLRQMKREAAQPPRAADTAPVKARVRKVIRPKILIDSDDLPRG